MTVEIRCEACGKSFDAARRARRFCSDTCRKRASRGNVISLPQRPKSGGRSASKSVGDVVTVLATTTAELDKLEQRATPLGAVALRLAERIDVGNETGAATAALARELRATMEAIEARVPAREGTVSSLRLRLLQRTTGA